MIIGRRWRREFSWKPRKERRPKPRNELIIVDPRVHEIYCRKGRVGGDAYRDQIDVPQETAILKRMEHKMTHITSMLDAYPKDIESVDREKLAACIAACFECAQTCTACADACLAEDMVPDLTSCIRKNLDCAEICATTGAVLSRQTGTTIDVTRAILEACRTACKACGEECEQHEGRHEHCRVCAEACRRCEQACADLLASLG